MSLHDQATPAVTKLLKSEEDQLLAELGLRTQALGSDIGVAASFTPALVYDGKTMGPLDDLKEIGKRVFKRWNVEAYKLACGADADDAGQRKELLEAFGLGDAAAAAALTALLISSAGLAPILAPVVAALLIKRIVAPAGQEVCAYWKGQLPADQ